MTILKELIETLSADCVRLVRLSCRSTWRVRNIWYRRTKFIIELLSIFYF